MGALTLSPATAEAKAKSPVVAGVLNWVLPGAGYIYNGEKPLYVTLPMMVGAVGLTYVENFHDFGGGNNLQATDPTAFNIMFGSVLTVNTGLAIDAYQEANRINEVARMHDPIGDNALSASFISSPLGTDYTALRPSFDVPLAAQGYDVPIPTTTNSVVFLTPLD